MNKNTDVCQNCSGKSSFLTSTTDYNRKISEDNFEYRRCDTCGLIFLANVPKDLGEYYPDHYYVFPAADRLIKIASKIDYQIGMIKPFATNGKLLDVGAGLGVFALKAIEAGYDVSAIEMDQRSCEYISKHMNANVFMGDNPHEIIRDMGNYHVITFWHTIEHFLDPWATLREASYKIDLGGVILVATPNPDSLAFKLLGRRWPHLDAPRHINLIPEKTLTMYMQKYGLELVMKTTNDKGGKSWNRFSWQRVLMNQYESRLLQSLAFVVGWIISMAMSIFEQRRFKGSAYTTIYRKTQTKLP